MTDLTLFDATPTEAQELTDRIRATADDLWRLLQEAHERKAWKALGYGSWEKYVSTEFNISRPRSYELLNKAKVMQAVEAAVSDASDIRLTARQVRDVAGLEPQLLARLERSTRQEDEADAEFVERVIEEMRLTRRLANPENWHPITTTLPWLDTAAWAAFKQSIDQMGCLEPVVVLRDGRVLDGRMRAVACWELNLTPPTHTFTFEDNESILDHWVSLNVVRQHLSPDQRAAITVNADTALRAQNDLLEAVVESWDHDNGDTLEAGAARLRALQTVTGIADYDMDLDIREVPDVVNLLDRQRELGAQAESIARADVARYEEILQGLREDLAAEE